MTLEHLDTAISFAVIIAGVSLLVTTLTQMVSALFGLRGTNLRWGIATLLQHADPELAAHATTIAENVLHNQVISDSTVSSFDSKLFARWKLASAISKDELIQILRMLPERTKSTPDKPVPWIEALDNSFDQLDRAATDKLLQLAPAVTLLFPDDPAKVDNVISHLTDTAEQLTGNIDKWFDTVMGRVSQRFAMHMRIWTIVFSILIVFAMHLDAFKLLTQLSTDSELRARLVLSAEALTKKADEMHVGSTNDVSLVDAAATKRLANAANDFQDILNNKLRFQLVPDPYPQPFCNYWTPGWSHFWGIVASAALLSLGAPFWFNMLKTLSNLRPMLAQKEEDGSSAAQGS